MPTHPRRPAFLLTLAAFLWLSLDACKNGGSPASAPPPERPSPIASTLRPAPAPSLPSGSASGAPASPENSPQAEPRRIEVKETAMGTHLTFVTYTTAALDEAQTRAAVARAVGE